MWLRELLSRWIGAVSCSDVASCQNGGIEMCGIVCSVRCGEEGRVVCLGSVACVACVSTWISHYCVAWLKVVRGRSQSMPSCPLRMPMVGANTFNEGDEE